MLWVYRSFQKSMIPFHQQLYNVQSKQVMHTFRKTMPDVPGLTRFCFIFFSFFSRLPDCVAACLSGFPCACISRRHFPWNYHTKQHVPHCWQTLCSRGGSPTHGIHPGSGPQRKKKGQERKSKGNSDPLTNHAIHTHNALFAWLLLFLPLNPTWGSSPWAPFLLTGPNWL